MCVFLRLNISHTTSSIWSGSALLTRSPGAASLHCARKNYLGRLLDLGQFSLSLQPIVQVMSLISSTLLVELKGTRTKFGPAIHCHRPSFRALL